MRCLADLIRAAKSLMRRVPAVVDSPIILPLRHVCNFPTAKDGRPLSIEIKLREMPQGMFHEYKFSVSVSGALHPYDPGCASGFFGDINKNPALLSALYFLKKQTSLFVKRGLATAGISIASINTLDSEKLENGRRLTQDHAEGFEQVLGINPDNDIFRSADYKSASLQQMQKLFQFVVAKFEGCKPDIQAMIDGGRDKEPPDDPVQIMAHHSNLALARTQGAMQAGWVIAAEPDDIEAMGRIAHGLGVKRLFLRFRRDL